MKVDFLECNRTACLGHSLEAKGSGTVLTIVEECQVFNETQRHKRIHVLVVHNYNAVRCLLIVD